MTQQRNGKTVGIFVDEDAYARYAGLGLRARKAVLAAAREALVCALDQQGSHQRENKPAAPGVEPPTPAPVATGISEKPAAQKPVPAAEGPSALDAGTDATADPSLAGFLDAGW